MVHRSSSPRVLVVGATLTESSGAGIYLGRLFSRWDPVEIACVAEYSSVQDPNWARCKNFYRLGDSEFKICRILVPFVPPRNSWHISQGSVAVSDFQSSRGRSVVTRYLFGLAQTCWRSLLRITGGGEVLYKVAISDALRDFILEFQPDIIYAQCSSLNGVRLATRLRESLNLPLVLHCMDDFPAFAYPGVGTTWLIRQRFLNEFRQLMLAADTVLGICEEMAAAYRDRYHRAIRSLGMPADLAGYKTVRRTDWKANRPFRLQFAGRVGWALRECLSDVASAVGALVSEGIDVVFEIYTFNPQDIPQSCHGCSWVIVRDAVASNELPILQASADSLVVCLDHSALAFHQARYSMPSKLAGCLASGTPILAYGPRGLPFIEYARRTGYGLLVDTRDPSALKQAIRSLFDSVNLREMLGRRGMELAAAENDMTVISDKLCEIMRSPTDMARHIWNTSNVGACKFRKG